MAKVLFSRPNHDPIVAYLYIYSKELIKYAEDKGYQVLNHEKVDANRKVIESVLRKQKPDLIMFNGHGNTDVVCGHGDEELIESNKNHKLLKSAIIYSLSCASAAGLGKLSVQDGAISFIGYQDDFALGRDLTYDANPHKDKIGRLFLEPSNILMKSLLKGNAISLAIEKCKQKMQEDISKLRMSTEDIHQDALPYLHSNYDSLVFHGDSNAHL